MALCICGCGGEAPIIPRTLTRDGYVKGESYRYIQGHHKRNKPTKRYRYVRVGDTFRKAHILRAEKALGKPLPLGAVVHHADGSKNEKAPLVICQDQAYHFLLHARMRVVRAGGDPNTEKICGHCKKVLPLTTFNRDASLSSGWGSRCKPCRKILRRRSTTVSEAA